MSLIKRTVSQAFERSFDLVRGVDLFEFQDFLIQCKARLEASMRIAMIGEICSSKSTLVNAMLGERGVVRTGAMEETFNVSWLRQGPADSAVRVHFRNSGRRSEEVARGRWADWANRLGQDEMKDSIQYIEVTHDNSLLNTFNLIDTPGLNSYYGADSRNTIEFLTDFEPDAIVVLFSHSIAQRTVDVIRSFQGPVFQNISPINAVGVLTKIDDYWPGEESPLSTGRRITERLMREDASVRTAFFGLYPVSSLLALGARTLDSNDMDQLNSLLKMPDAKLTSMFKSVKRFLKEDEDIPLSVAERDSLAGKFTMYGVFLALDFLRQAPNMDEQALEERLVAESGFDRFFRDILDHFGNRAFVIKLSGVLSAIQRESQRLLESVDSTQAGIVQDIANSFSEIALRHQAFRELDLLKRHFNGELSLNTEEKEELLRVTGEYGVSCRERLGLADTGSSVEEMRRAAEDRAVFWNSRLVTSIDPDLKSVAQVMKGSYREIARQIENAQARRLEAERELFGDSNHREQEIRIL